MMRNRKHLITTAVGLVLLALLIIALLPAPAQVNASRAQLGYFAEYIEDEGRTRLRDTYTVSAPIGGFLRRVELEPGDSVTAGDTVFTLEPTPAPALDPRSREQARESLSAARARLDAARAELENHQAETRFAESEFKRHQQLFERGLVSATDMDRVRSVLERSQSAERAAAAAIEVARFELENARAVLEIAEGTRSPDESLLLRVSAPVGGVVLRRDRCCEGVIQPGEPVLVIGDLAELEVQVDLLSMQAVRVEPGTRVIIQRWGGADDLEGQVRRVEPAGFKRVSALGVDEWRVPVLIELTSPPQAWARLGEGFRVEARFVLWEGEQVLHIPSSALFRVDETWHVYVVENGRARLRAVQVGRRSGLFSQILDGLRADEITITHPGAHIEDGSRVNAELRDRN